MITPNNIQSTVAIGLRSQSPTIPKDATALDVVTKDATALDATALDATALDALSARVSGKHNGEANGREWIIGIDPGHSGALAGINPQTGALAFLDMPVRTFGATANRREVKAEAVADWLRKHPPLSIWLEEVWGLPGDGGVNGFSFGDSYGTIRGVAAGIGTPITKIRPGVWKANVGVTSNKDTSRARAVKLFPTTFNVLARKMDDGRAEAMLIAFYGMLSLNITPKKVIEYVQEEGTRIKGSSR